MKILSFCIVACLIIVVTTSGNVINVPSQEQTAQSGIDVTISGNLVTTADATNAAPVGAQRVGKSIEDFVSPDGRIDIDALRASGYQGPLDLRGFDAQFDPRTGEPLFSPAAGLDSPSDHPDDIYWDNSISPSVRGVNGTVSSTTVFNGQLIVGGYFTMAGSVAASNIARWDGSAWEPLGSGMNSSVGPLTVYNGDLIAAGDFTTAGGVAANSIARWDGSTWQSLGSGMDNPVYSLAVYDGDLIAAGDFTTAGGVAANSIARWDGSTWQPLGSGINSYVFSLTIYNGDLIAGGYFDSAGGVAVNNIARWDGSTWQPLGSGISGAGFWGSPVSCLTVYDGDLIVGGYFYSAGGVAASNIAGWDGSTWHPLGSGMSGGAWGTHVLGLTVYDGDLIAGGTFRLAGGVDAMYIARWDGSTWQPLGSGMTGSVGELTVYNGDLIAGGSFWAAGGVSTSRIARWDGSTWQPLGSGVSDWVNSLAVYDGDLIAGGDFWGAGAIAANYIARWDGSTWQSLGSGMDSSVYSLSVYDGDLIAGGRFRTSGGDSANYVARWDGSTWQPLGSGRGYPVHCLTVYNGDLIAGDEGPLTTPAGGELTSASGVEAYYIARWDGSIWQPLGSGIDEWVSSLTVYGGDLIAGGYFTSAGGVAVNHIARWDGAAWQPLGSGINSYVSSLTVYNGDLIAGGRFTTAGGVSASNIARWDGSAWQPLGLGLDSAVYSLTVYDGDLIAGGKFTMAGGVAANYIARWDGTTWEPLGSGMNGSVRSLTVYNGVLIAGGLFTRAGGKFSAYIAQWTQRTKLTVNFDIKPGSCPNPLNAMNQSGHGKAVLPTAILGADDFDVHDIDPESITLNGVGPIRWSYEDVSTPVDKDQDSCACSEDDPDGLEDLALKFDRQAIISSLNSISTNQSGTMAALAKGFSPANGVSDNSNHSGSPLRTSYVLRVEGQLKDGTDFEGYDCVMLMTERDITAKAADEAPRELELIGNKPNPFNPVTEISFYLPGAMHVTIDIYNVLGQRVERLKDDDMEAGQHTVIWDGSDVATGVYFYHLEAGDFVKSKKMLLLK